MKLSIVVPCYNEEDNIDKLRTEFFPVITALIGSRLPDGGPIEGVEVVFVDDGSKDGTYQALKSAFTSYDHPAISVKFEKHEMNRGLGAALRTGFEAVSGDVIITTDSDGTYQFSTIPAMLGHLTKDVAIVTASPYHPRGEVVGVPGYRIFLSRGSSLLYRLLLSWRIHTYTALFRAYRREVLETNAWSLGHGAPNPAIPAALREGFSNQAMNSFHFFWTPCPFRVLPLHHSMVPRPILRSPIAETCERSM